VSIFFFNLYVNESCSVNIFQFFFFQFIYLNESCSVNFFQFFFCNLHVNESCSVNFFQFSSELMFENPRATFCELLFARTELQGGEDS